MPTRMSFATPLVICVPGPKGKLVLGKLLEDHADKFSSPISHTSRDIREGEVDGVDYMFVDPEEMARMENAGELIESYTVGETTYATAKASIAKVACDGKVPLLDVDAKGATTISKTGLKACYLVVMPPPEAPEAKELAAELDALNKMDIFEESIFDGDMEKALIQLRGAVCRRCFTATHGA